MTGFWYETELGSEEFRNEEQLAAYVNDVHTECVTGRDKDGSGQSPHDNSSTGQEILAALTKHFQQLEYRPHLIHLSPARRLARPDEAIYKIADFWRYMTTWPSTKVT